MRWLIVGAGALGSILAGLLSASGEDVTLLARGARAKHLARIGLRLTGLAELSVPIQIAEAPQDIEGVDVVVVAVKSYDTMAAIEALSHLAPTSVFSIQNGMAKDDQLASVFGKDAVLGCAADFSGELQPDGAVRFTRNQGLYIGELEGGVSQRATETVEMLSKAGFQTEARSDIEAVEWSKLVGWVAAVPGPVLTRLETHRVLQDADLARLHWQLAREAAMVTTALGISLLDMTTVSPALTLTSSTEEAWVETSRSLGASMAAEGVTIHKISALQDLERGRRLELDETYGYILNKGRELGIELPRLETCYRLLLALDRRRT